MSLSEQESHCIKLTCDHLSSILGGGWTIDHVLDELYPEEPTPEVIVNNGDISAAIEVKRLTGDSVSQNYYKYLLHCERHLVPSCGGYYTLTPPVNFHLPMDIKLFKHIKREIERVAPSLEQDETGAIKVPRSGYVSRGSETASPSIYCLHAGPISELLTPVMEKIKGRYMLVDKGLEHSFVTEECKKAFQDAVVAACESPLCGITKPFDWDEEWELERLPDGISEEKDSGAVQIWTCTPARAIRESVAECVYMVLTNAVRKFEKRWAQYHILILDRDTDAPDQYITEAIEELGVDELRNLDFIYRVDGDNILRCYPAAIKRSA
ncbi:MAG TPA: hypothetical protein G4O06_04730 [Dehalococcoidia bacterium]|nr:hypothetical protein [Dehalococcoidia bacterium]